MSGKVRVTREAIIEAALGMVREGGWASVSARSLAERLSCSTMPIYSAIGSMDILRAALLEEANRLLEGYQARRRSSTPLMDMAVGYIVFAREERKLFHFLFDTDGGPALSKEELEARMATNGTFARLAAMQELSRNHGQALAFHSWIYIHGLATLVADGVLAPSDGELSAWLDLAGRAFWVATGGGKE
jgi:AcrR family transcriptional regulator